MNQALGCCGITDCYLTIYVYVRSNSAVLVKIFFCKTKEDGILFLQKWLLYIVVIYLAVGEWMWGCVGVKSWVLKCC